MDPWIRLTGATENNLKNLSLEIPKRQLIAFTGKSGSGKSSLVFDTLYIESLRRFSEASHIPLFYQSNYKKAVRPHFQSLTGLPPALGLSQKQGVLGNLSTVGTLCGLVDLLRVYFVSFGIPTCSQCEIPLESFSVTQIIEKIFKDYKDQKISLLAPLVHKRKGSHGKLLEKILESGFSKIYLNDEIVDIQKQMPKISSDTLNSIDVIIDRLQVKSTVSLEKSIVNALDWGKGCLTVIQDDIKVYFNTKKTCPLCGQSALSLDPRHLSHSSLGQCTSCHGTGSEEEDLPADLYPCKSCGGSRIEDFGVRLLLDKYDFSYLNQQPISKLKSFFETLKKTALLHPAQKKVFSEMERIFNVLLNLNLDHLNLGRSANSLSPSEIQRLRLSNLFSNQLQGMLYILDEPCQGLTSLEVENLILLLQKMIKNGASILTVEHHPHFLKRCDGVFVLGPDAGKEGGYITSIHTSQNPYSENKPLIKTSFNQDKTKLTPFLELKNIKIRNVSLKSFTLYEKGIHIIRGKSGSGKSTLLQECIYPALKKHESVTSLQDIRPGSLKKTSHRVLASVLGFLPLLRKFWARLPMSQILGLTDSHFSWSSSLGQCPSCKGKGYHQLISKYSPPIEYECPQCEGQRLHPQSLLTQYQGLHFFQMLQKNAQEALPLIGHLPRFKTHLQNLVQFGLGYIPLSQTLSELSGGELQRLHLSQELSQRKINGRWYLLFHPSTGLHTHDIEILGNLMKKLTTQGSSFVLIENREEFIPYADICLDLS
jgi:excinuclease ABC subunit A